jgi:hypothetical protein
MLHRVRRAERALLSYERTGWLDDTPARVTGRMEVRGALHTAPLGPPLPLQLWWCVCRGWCCEGSSIPGVHSAQCLALSNLHTMHPNFQAPHPPPANLAPHTHTHTHPSTHPLTLPPLPSPPPQVRPAAEQGPIILCLDTSGSMSGAREVVAKALALECLRGAHRQKRACYLYAFSGPSEWPLGDRGLWLLWGVVVWALVEGQGEDGQLAQPQQLHCALLTASTRDHTRLHL